MGTHSIEPRRDLFSASHRHPWWVRYPAAAAIVLVAIFIRSALSPSIGPNALPFVFFFPAVTAAAWFGGLGPGILATVFSSVAANWFFFRHSPGFALSRVEDVSAIVAFLIASAFILGAIAALHRARAGLKEEIDMRRELDAQAGLARDLLETTVASIGDGVIVTDPEARVTSMNPEAERLTGWKRDEALGQPLETVFRILNEESRTVPDNPALRALREGKVVALANHTVLVRRDGTEISIDDTAAPIRRTGGPVMGAVLVFRDAKSQRRAHDAIARLAAIVEHSGDAIATKDLNGTIQTWNLGAERLFGYKAAEIIGKPVLTLIPPELHEEEREILDRLRAGQPYERLETIRVAKDGRRIPVALSVSPLLDRDGRVVGASKILHDISDRVVAREARQRAEDLRREEDRRKDEFLAILAHELRNPLAPIQMAIGMLQRIGSADPRVQELRGVIVRQTTQLSRLLDDLMDVNRIASGKIVLRPERVALSLAIANAVESVRPLVRERNHELAVTVTQEPLDVEGDLARLSQVFTNLLNNAAKYTPPGGRIALAAGREGAEAVVRIRDNGIGIAPDQIGRVFEMFTQLDPSLERGHGGLGVGLSLSRKLVEMHGGRLEARSEGVKRGSEFTVRLPLAAEAPADPKPGDQAVPALKNGKGCRILIADDNADAATLLGWALGEAGHDVRTAGDGESAVEIASAFHPRLAILDIGMPRLNGYAAAKRIREALGNEVVLIAITGWGQEADKQRAKEAGFDHHLTKPVELGAIQRLIADLR